MNLHEELLKKQKYINLNFADPTLPCRWEYMVTVKEVMDIVEEIMNSGRGAIAKVSPEILKQSDDNYEVFCLRKMILYAELAIMKYNKEKI